MGEKIVSLTNIQLTKGDCKAIFYREAMTESWRAEAPGVFSGGGWRVKKFLKVHVCLRVSAAKNSAAKMDLNNITYKINGAIFEVNRTLGPGFMETLKKVGTDYTDFAVQNKIRNKKRPIASALNRVIRAIRAKILSRVCLPGRSSESEDWSVARPFSAADPRRHTQTK